MGSKEVYNCGVLQAKKLITLYCRFCLNFVSGLPMIAIRKKKICHKKGKTDLSSVASAKEEGFSIKSKLPFLI